MGGGKQDGEMGGKTGKSGTPVVVKKKDGGIEGGGMRNGKSLTQAVPCRDRGWQL